MKFPPDATYSGYRIPLADLTNYNAPIFYRNHPPTEGEETSVLGSFHKDRFFGHFTTFSKFDMPSEVGEAPIVSRLSASSSDASHHLGSFPDFWRKAGRTNGGANKPFGYAHHFAETGPDTNGSTLFRGIFDRSGRGASNTSGQVEIIYDVRGKAADGTYISVPYTGLAKNLRAERTPFHAKYNIFSKSHDYPRALYDNESDFKILVKGKIVNPLSKASTYGSRSGFSFSVFRHYGSSSIRSEGIVLLTIPSSPASNPLAIAQGGWGHDYIVKQAKYRNNELIPGSPISRRNWKTQLDIIEVYSPYGDAVKLDFLNGLRYDSLLHSSSIWSK